jgi:dynein heavy chain
VEAFRAAIEALPVQESPEIYGLHPNADLTFRTLQVGAGTALGSTGWLLPGSAFKPHKLAADPCILCTHTTQTHTHPQVRDAVSTILDTMPKGSGGGGGLSREEIVDRICEDLLSKVI